MNLEREPAGYRQQQENEEEMRMDRSESITELASAFAKAQGAFAGAVRDSVNPHFKSKYADLESVVAAIKPGMSANGLSFVQISHNDAGAASIETIIMHSSGEWLSAGIVSVPTQKNDAHGFGSAMTYARRYSLSAALGVAPEDDDGNGAVKKDSPPLPTYTDEQLAANLPAWQTSLDAGKTTPERLVAMVGSKYTLTPEQKGVILAMKKTVTDAEFVEDYEAAERAAIQGAA